MRARDRQYVDQALEALVRVFKTGALKPLEARVAALEQSGPKSLADAYKGTFKAGKSYQRGCLVTDKGGLFFCRHDTTTRPGTSADWQLCVKGGR